MLSFLGFGDTFSWFSSHLSWLLHLTVKVEVFQSPSCPGGPYALSVTPALASKLVLSNTHWPPPAPEYFLCTRRPRSHVLLNTPTSCRLQLALPHSYSPRNASAVHLVTLAKTSESFLVSLFPSSPPAPAGPLHSISPEYLNRVTPHPSTVSLLPFPTCPPSPCPTNHASPNSHAQSCHHPA